MMLPMLTQLLPQFAGAGVATTPTMEQLQLQLMQQATANRGGQQGVSGLPAGKGPLGLLGPMALKTPSVVAPLAIASGLFAHGAMMKSKRKEQRKRREIKIQAGIERGRETQAITESALGTARRMGSDVAAVSAANGMGGSGPAMNAVLQNRAQILSGIPEQVRAARQAISQQEQARLAETGDGTEIPAFMLRTMLPMLFGK